MTPIRIALDAMGGDHGPAIVVPAALDALSKHANLSLILVGAEDLIQDQVKAYPGYSNLQNRFSIIHTDEFVSMDESPLKALRSKKHSSMRLAINCVKEGLSDACVSAGNTGALMAMAKFVLKTLPGIDRPALVYCMPCLAGIEGAPLFSRMLDLGANVDCQSEHLVQFALMGHIQAKAVDGLDRPRVALLNIGSEDMKGTDSVRQAHARLSALSEINYIGFVEGHDIYTGKADVIVCDGFVGNVALKSAEGILKALMKLAKDELLSSFRGKMAALLAKPTLLSMKDRYDPRHHNGASFLGLNGIVLKSHGNADRPSYVMAIEEAIKEVRFNLPQSIGSSLLLHTESIRG